MILTYSISVKYMECIVNKIVYKLILDKENNDLNKLNKYFKRIYPIIIPVSDYSNNECTSY